MLLADSEVSEVSTRTHLQARPPAIETPWYKGMGEGISSGFQHGFAVANLTTESESDKMDAAEKRVKETRPDPIKIGTAGQLLHGLSTIAAYGVVGASGGATTGAVIGGAGGAVVGGAGAIPGAVAGASFGAGAGAVASIGYLSGVDKFFELTDQGIDADTAIKAAGLTGVVMSAGAGLPAYLGKTLGRQVLSGIGINEVLGMTERGATGEILRNSGYEKVAEHYKALDAQGMVLDALLGAAFPLVGRMLGGRKARAEDIDAALTLEQDVAGQTRNPSLESSLENIQALRENLATADRQLMAEGRTQTDIDVPRASTDVPNPEYGAMVRQMEGEINDHIFRDTGVSRADWDADIRRAIELDEEVNRSINERISREVETVETQAKESGTVPDKAPTADEMTLDSFARQDAELFAKAAPDTVIKDSEGRAVKAEHFNEYIDGVIRVGDEDAFLHNVAIACSLTHGE